jgi:hypothetical protein
MRTGRGGACLALGLLVALASPSASRAAPTLVLDQELDAPVDTAAAINEGCRYVAQTYTARKTGWLRAVALHIVSSSAYDLKLSLREVRGGVPTRVIWSATKLTTADTELSDVIDLDDAAPQIPGRRYALVVEYPAAPPAGAHQAQGDWQGTSGDPYPHGEALCSNDGIAWAPVLAGVDLRFRTYVEQLRFGGGRDSCATAKAR